MSIIFIFSKYTIKEVPTSLYSQLSSLTKKQKIVFICPQKRTFTAILDLLSIKEKKDFYDFSYVKIIPFSRFTVISKMNDYLSKKLIKWSVNRMRSRQDMQKIIFWFFHPDQYSQLSSFYKTANSATYIFDTIDLESESSPNENSRYFNYRNKFTGVVLSSSTGETVKIIDWKDNKMKFSKTITFLSNL